MVQRINFYGASWCGACKPQRSAWETSAVKHGVEFNYIDVDLEPEDAGINGVKTLPHVIIDRADNRPIVVYGAIKVSEIDKIVRGEI